MEVFASRCVPRAPGKSLHKDQRLALAAISVGFLMITLDATIVNVALGAIGADLGGSPAVAQWVVDGYTVAFASLLLLAGSLADRIGVRRGFIVGLAGRRTVGVDGELSDDEGCEEQQSRFDRGGVREGHFDRPAAPTLAVDEDELAFALGERIALAPAAGWAQRELAASPVKLPASAQVSR